LIELKQDEFWVLKQGSMSVCEYHDRFTQLSRYAPNEVREDADKQHLFLKGIYYDLRLQLKGHTYPNFHVLVDRAIVLDDMRKEHDRKRRKMQHQSTGSNTCLDFAAQPEYQSHSMNLLGSIDQDRYQFQQPNNDVHYFNSQEPCLSPLIINTSEEGHGCGEIEHYENDCLEKFTKSNCS
jgi:hypothetical protein